MSLAKLLDCFQHFWRKMFTDAVRKRTMLGLFLRCAFSLKICRRCVDLFLYFSRRVRFNLAHTLCREVEFVSEICERDYLVGRMPRFDDAPFMVVRLSTAWAIALLRFSRSCLMSTLSWLSRLNHHAPPFF